MSRRELKDLVVLLGQSCGDNVLTHAMQQVSNNSNWVPGTKTVSTADTDMNDSKRSVKIDSMNPKKKRKVKGEFDMSYFSQRHVCLHVAYFGDKYHGFALGDSSAETVETHLFSALSRARLITDAKSANYSRCGRTDAGVSAFSQVVSITLRSNLAKSLPAASCIPASKFRESSCSGNDDDMEINYPAVLNKILPDDIFVLGWCPAPSLEFKSRFNAESRTYQYYFMPRKLDIDKMKVAASYLVGTHDFRNFCRMDVTNVNHFTRRIHKIIIEPRENDLFVFKITGNAFLWNQIRYIVEILFLVGRGHEEPSIVQTLLDVAKVPRKPVYDKASEVPLILFASEYCKHDVQFKYDDKTLNNLRDRLSLRHSRFAVRAGMTQSVIDEIDSLAKGSLTKVEYDFVSRKSSSRKHIPLGNRDTCDSYEEKIAGLSSKKKHLVRERHGWDYSHIT